MMRALYPFLLFCILLAGFMISCEGKVVDGDAQLSSADSSEITAEIQKVLDLQTGCWNHGNIECFTSYYANKPYSCIMGSEGPICGQKNITEVYQKAYPEGEMGKLSFADVEIHPLSSSIGLVRGRYILEYPDKPSDSGWYTLVFEKFGERWMIVGDQTG